MGGMPRTGAQPRPEENVSGWTGWIVFAGVMAILLGTFQIIEGLTALFRHSYYFVSQNHLLVHVNYTAWGWTHLILGILIVVTGFGLLAGLMWARVIGVILAILSAIVNLGFLPAYPIWSTLMIAFNVILIYAITAHGHELKNERW
jgi:hypothetical protein